MTSNVCSKRHQFTHSAEFEHFIDKLRELMCAEFCARSKMDVTLARRGQDEPERMRRNSVLYESVRHRLH